MTDYEGLGTYGVHPYLLGESEGRGILDVVPAVRELAAADDVNGPGIAREYVIVGHSQGGQAALFGAHLAQRDSAVYADRGTLLGVAALAPASNLKGTALPIKEEDRGLLVAYQLGQPIPDLAGFIALFTNGVCGGKPDIDLDQIFQEQGKTRYDEDHDALARVQLSESPFWSGTAPFVRQDPPAGIFRAQGSPAWTDYWTQVDAFNPDKDIAVPIRISQAEGDARVQAPAARQRGDRTAGGVGRRSGGLSGDVGPARASSSTSSGDAVDDCPRLEPQPCGASGSLSLRWLPLGSRTAASRTP
jgi:hypothetical protein